MKSRFHFEPFKEMGKINVEKLQKEISNSFPTLEHNLDRLLDYLRKEEEAENYIEINLPIINSDLCFKLNLYYGKVIISVIISPNFEIIGHLLIDGFDCLGAKEIKRLGSWETYDKDISRFKEFSE